VPFAEFLRPGGGGGAGDGGTVDVALSADDELSSVARDRAAGAGVGVTGKGPESSSEERLDITLSTDTDGFRRVAAGSAGDASSLAVLDCCARGGGGAGGGGLVSGTELAPEERLDITLSTDTDLTDCFRRVVAIDCERVERAGAPDRERKFGSLNVFRRSKFLCCGGVVDDDSSDDDKSSRDVDLCR